MPTEAGAGATCRTRPVSFAVSACEGPLYSECHGVLILFTPLYGGADNNSICRVTLLAELIEQYLRGTCRYQGVSQHLEGFRNLEKELR